MKKIGKKGKSILHIGGDTIVPLAHILFILDYQKTVDKKASASFQNMEEKGAECIWLCSKKIKSVIFTSDGTRQKIYFSPISSGTLYKRACELGA